MKRFELRVMLLLAILCLNALTFAQANDGINFERNLSWQQIVQKAKAENKYIFVDCFATWCRPCLEMDRKIFPLQNIGNFFNENFISVRLQMDTSAKDNE